MQQVGPLKDSTESIISDSRAIADLLNNYFCSVFTVEDLSFIPKASSKFDFNNSEILSEIRIDENLVEEKLHKLNTSKSQGADELNHYLNFETSFLNH
jgi:hypothetical protein